MQDSKSDTTYYNRKDYYDTISGNKVSKESILAGIKLIVLQGKVNNIEFINSVCDLLHLIFSYFLLFN